MSQMHIHLHEISRTEKSINIESILAVAKGYEEGEGCRRNCLMVKDFYFGVKKMLQNYVRGGGYTIL